MRRHRFWDTIRSQTFLRIILPQVMKRILPSVTNEMITLVKDTSLAFTIGILEMFTGIKGTGIFTGKYDSLCFCGNFLLHILTL